MSSGAVFALKIMAYVSLSRLADIDVQVFKVCRGFARLRKGDSACYRNLSITIHSLPFFDSPPTS